MREFVKWAGGIVAAVLAGVLVYWLTVGLGGSDGDGPLPTTTSPPVTTTSPTTRPTTRPTTSRPPLSFLQRVQGNWTLRSWTEAGGPTTLYLDVLNGTLQITDAGQASWRLDIQERGQPTSPQPGIRCGGQTTLAGKIEGVPGGDQNSEINWTADLHSVDHSSTGEGRIWRALCGWAVIGTRAPFTVALDGDATQTAARIEMTNRYGMFRWSRA